MDLVEFHFKVDGEETLRQYEVAAFDEASRKYHLEFPDEETRPRVFEVRVKHLKPKLV
jgi:hypothetical protein